MVDRSCQRVAWRIIRRWRRDTSQMASKRDPALVFVCASFWQNPRLGLMKSRSILGKALENDQRRLSDDLWMKKTLMSVNIVRKRTSIETFVMKIERTSDIIEATMCMSLRLGDGSDWNQRNMSKICSGFRRYLYSNPFPRSTWHAVTTVG